MKSLLQNRPILFAVLLGIVITVIVAFFTIISGQHHYYRIYGGGDIISDIQIKQIDDNGSEIELIEVATIEYEKNYALIHFDAKQAGSGMLQVFYTRQIASGAEQEEMKEISLNVSRMKVIYIGDGSYNHSGFSVPCYGIIIYSFLMMLSFIWRRKIIRKESLYTYEYIGTWSGQIFFTMIFLVYTAVVLIVILLGERFDEIVLDILIRYLLMLMTVLTFPVVFVFAVSMTISNLSLMRHEGKKVNNMLGIVAGFGLLFMIAVVFVMFMLFAGYDNGNAVLSIAYFIVNAFYLVFFSVLGGAIISGLKAGTYTPTMDKDYIIILGCAIRKDGTLYPLIKGRVDKAVDFWKNQQQLTGKKAIFVPSGGQGNDEIISEGEAMKRYLLVQGIPEECILAETNSTNTYENMKFSKELIEKINPSAKIAFSTTNYHVMRAGILACKAGLEAEGMGARTKWYFWPNALLREVVGMFAYRPKIQLLSMLILTLLAAATGYLYSLL